MTDPAPSGLEGCVRIGVAYPTGDDWLEVRLDGQRAHAGAPEEGRGVDVSLLMGDYEVKRLLMGRRLPHAPLFSVHGDDRLLAKFMKRYLREKRWSGLRWAE
ncbi:MAG: hypothetical protein AAFU79_17530 [Myxococcota bacterium]